MRDNSDVQEIHNGRVTDMRIESVLNCIIEERWDENELDTLFTELVQEFIAEDTPHLLVSQIARHSHQAQGLLYLDLFSMDYELVHKAGPQWPGDFDYMPKAGYAIRARLPDSENDYTHWAPGTSPCVAALMAIMQVCREVSDQLYNKDGNHLLN